MADAVAIRHQIGEMAMRPRTVSRGRTRCDHLEWYLSPVMQRSRGILRSLLSPESAIVLAAIVFTLAVFEIVLRAYPSLIAVPILDRMAPDLRLEIANRLNLSTKSTRNVIKSADRADGGPDLYVYHPNRVLIFPADGIDKELGAIDDMRIDRNGFCNPPEDAAKPRQDVILIGDSNTFCTGITPEQTSSAQLGKALGRPAYNLGIPGVGPFEYVEILEKFGIRMAPKAVIMMVYEGNDLRDADRFVQFKQNGETRTQNGGPVALAWSYALSFVVAAVEQQVGELRAFDDVNFRYSISLGSKRFAMNVFNNDRDEARNSYRIASGELSPALFGPAFDRFRALGRDQGFVPVIALLPSGYTAFARSVVFDDKELGKTLATASETIRGWIANYSKTHGVNFIDLKDAFQGAAESGVLTHFPANLHITPAGNAVVAAALAERLNGLDGLQ